MVCPQYLVLGNILETDSGLWQLVQNEQCCSEALCVDFFLLVE